MRKTGCFNKRPVFYSFVRGNRARLPLQNLILSVFLLLATGNRNCP
jgi:hypothetical protein